ncbi:hypothetical protein [Blastopirellula marina]|nr:hypothetical protein [Blastopirellula marina]
MDVLIQFLLRLAFGLGVAMLVTSSRQVDAGFYRVHLWIGLGLTAGAAAAGTTIGPTAATSHFYFYAAAISAAAASYVAAVLWLYEYALAGKMGIAIFTILCVVAGSMAVSGADQVAGAVDFVTGGLLLGSVTLAMLLGHWYLNNPGMKLAPLNRLVLLAVVAALLRCLLCAWGDVRQWPQLDALGGTFLALRWLWGFVAVWVLAAMTWQTLKIPNTQSATGILYVAVICVFLGELSSQLLSRGLPYPL